MSNPDKTALVTGAGRGIGRSISLELAKAGIRIVASARTEEELSSLKNEIENLGGSCSTYRADLSDRDQVNKLLNDLDHEKINVLINNAGVGSSQSPNPIVDFDDAFWDLTMFVNATVPYLLTKHLLPFMIKSRFGRIINISSINAKVPALHGAAYTASKHAIAGFTKAIANETAGTGVTANAICPGVTATKMNDLRIQYDAQRTGSEFESVEQKSTPYGRRLVPEEIAPLAAFLASDGANAINGQLINVCGGTVMA